MLRRIVLARHFSSSPLVRSSVTKSGIPSATSTKLTTTQACNRETTWSANQRSRAEAMSGPRFEQTNMEFQPQPPAAIEMIKAQPVIMVQSRVAVCDGGGGALGHPKVYINLDPNGPNECGYCGLRFQQEHHH